MYLNKRWVRLVVGGVLFAAVLACQSSDIGFIAQQPTATRTRTPRPTFTPVPSPTLTLAPTSTPPPPPTTAPTKAPTRRPTTRVPTKAPTKAAPPPPAPVAQPTQPPAPSFEYAANPPWCEHAGGTYIKAKIYDSSDPSANGVGGVKVALGGPGGNEVWQTVTSFDDGVYSFTLAPDGHPAAKGTYYLWLMNGSGNRISDVGGPIVVNGLGPDAAGSCWAGHVDFWKR